MTFLLANWRLLLIAFAIGVSAGWIGHVKWTAAGRVGQLEAQVKEQVRDTKREAKAETHEQDIQQHDKSVVAKAEAAVPAVDYSACPRVSARYLRLLNSLGEVSASPSQLAGEVPGEAETSGG